MNKSLHFFRTAQRSDLKFFMFMKVLVIISSLFSKESQNAPKMTWNTSSCVWASAAQLAPFQQQVIAHHFFVLQKQCRSIQTLQCHRCIASYFDFQIQHKVLKQHATVLCLLLLSPCLSHQFSLAVYKLEILQFWSKQCSLLCLSCFHLHHHQKSNPDMLPILGSSISHFEKGSTFCFHNLFF